MVQTDRPFLIWVRSARDGWSKVVLKMLVCGPDRPRLMVDVIYSEYCARQINKRNNTVLAGQRPIGQHCPPCWALPCKLPPTSFGDSLFLFPKHDRSCKRLWPRCRDSSTVLTTQPTQEHHSRKAK